MPDNVLRFAVTLDDAGAIKGFRALKAEAAATGKGVQTHFGNATGALGKFEKGVGGMSGALSHAKGQIAGVAGSLGLLVGVGGVTGLVGVLAKSVTAARDFGNAMDLIQTQAGASAAEVQTMSAALVDMSRSVGTTPDQLATGLYHIESAGIRGAKALDVLRLAAEGAKVGNADLESVTNALVAATNSGVKGVDSMSGAMGTLNAIVGSGNMRMEDLTAALGTGILSTAKVFGVSMQSVGGALADMTNQGIPAVDAANGIRAAIRLMAAPTAAAAKELKSVGLSTTALASDLRSPGGILTAITDLKSHMDKAGLSATQQAALLTKAFGGKQSGAILTLVGNIGKLKSATDSVAAGASSFDAAWAKTEQDAGFKWDKFAATLQKDAVKIGDKLLPKVTDGLDAVGGWLDQHGTEIADVFGNAADAAVRIGSAVSGTVVPALKSIVGAFQSLPEPVKQLLIGGFVANKVVKWTFGFDVAGLAGGALKGAIEGLFKNATTANMNVQAANVNVAGGGAGSLASGAAGAAGSAEGPFAAEAAAGGLGAAGLATLVAGIALPIIMYQVLPKLVQGNGSAPTGASVTGSGGQDFGSLTPQQVGQMGNAVANQLAAKNAGSSMSANDRGGQNPNVTSTLPGSMSANDRGGQNEVVQALRLLAKPLDALHADFKAQMGLLSKATKPADVKAAAAKVAGDIVKGVGSVKTTNAAIDALRAAQAKALKAGNTELAKALGVDIAKVEAKLPGRKWIAQQERTADQIVASSKSTKEKIKELTAIQADFKKHGDTVAAAHIGAEIDSLKPYLRGIWNAIPSVGRGSTNTQGHAAGFLGMTTGRTSLGDLGIAGEIKGEAVAVIANPHPLSGGSRGGSGGVLDVHFHFHGVTTPGALAQAAREFAPALVREMQRNGILPRVASPMAG